MISFLGRLVLGLILNYVSYLLTPVPPGPKPAVIDDVKIPVTQEGEQASIIMGTAWIKNPHVVDSGDFESRPIRKKGGKK